MQPFPAAIPMVMGCRTRASQRCRSGSKLPFAPAMSVWPTSPASRWAPIANCAFRLGHCSRSFEGCWLTGRASMRKARTITTRRSPMWTCSLASVPPMRDGNWLRSSRTSLIPRRSPMRPAQSCRSRRASWFLGRRATPRPSARDIRQCRSIRRANLA